MKQKESGCRPDVILGISNHSLLHLSAPYKNTACIRISATGEENLLT